MKINKTLRYLAAGVVCLGLIGCGTPRPTGIKTETSEGAYVFKKSVYSDKFYGNGSCVEAAISVTCGDLDSDGDLEIIVAKNRGIIIYENQTPQQTKTKELRDQVEKVDNAE